MDDGSRDGSREILAALQSEYPQIRVVLQPHNMGKGAALRRGIQEATGDFVIIQDADLEYDPAEYPLMIEPLIQGKADVVFGSRFLGERAASRVVLLAFGRQPDSSLCFPIASPTSIFPTWRPATRSSGAK